MVIGSLDRQILLVERIHQVGLLGDSGRIGWIARGNSTGPSHASLSSKIERELPQVKAKVAFGSTDRNQEFPQKFELDRDKWLIAIAYRIRQVRVTGKASRCAPTGDRGDLCLKRRGSWRMLLGKAKSQIGNSGSYIVCILCRDQKVSIEGDGLCQ